MENILHDFEEKVISLMTEFLKNSMETGGLSNFTEDLKDNLMQLGYDLTKLSLEYAEDIIFKIKERKQQFESLEKDDRKIISIFGDIDFKRRYYLDKENNQRVYLLDEYFKIAPNERLLENVETKLIEEAIETNYEKAGKSVAYKTEISKIKTFIDTNPISLKNYYKYYKNTSTNTKRKTMLFSFVPRNS